MKVSVDDVLYWQYNYRFLSPGSLAGCTAGVAAFLAVSFFYIRGHEFAGVAAFLAVSFFYIRGHEFASFVQPWITY